MSHPTVRSYWDLPTPVHDAVAAQIGQVSHASPTGTGLRSVTALVEAGRGGRYFVKALPNSDQPVSMELPRVWAPMIEAKVAGHVQPIGARLIKRILRHYWDVLIFEALPGREADYRPGSADLTAVVQVLNTAGQLPPPVRLQLPTGPDRLRGYAGPGELDWFAGHHLLHTDVDASNIIVTDGTARLVDWGAATWGAAWLDAGFWVIRLIAAGHHPQAAENLAAKLRTWQQAPTGGLDAFAAANARLCTANLTAAPNPVAQPLADAANRWHQHRQARHT